MVSTFEELILDGSVVTPLGMLQAGLALAVPAALAAVINLGCGKKRDPRRPGSGAAGAKGAAKKKTLSKSSKSKRSIKSGKGSSGKKSKTKVVKSKRVTKSVDVSGKSAKSAKKSKGSKSSKSSKSKSKKSKRDTLKTGQQSSDKTKSVRSAAEDVKDSAKRAAEDTKDLAKSCGQAVKQGAKEVKQGVKEAAGKAADAIDNSAKSAKTQSSASMRQPPSGAGGVDANANAVIDSTRDLKMEPAELRWSATGGMQKISLLNQSGERQAIKVKCSDNNVYRVNPVYAFVEPGQTLNVDVMRQNGSNKVDKIVFVTAKAGAEENPKNLFKPGTQSSMMVLPLLATSAAAASCQYQQPALTAAV